MSVQTLGAVRHERWLAADPGSAWQLACVIGVERGAAATVLRLRLPEVPHFLPGQYFKFRLAIETAPGAVQEDYSVCSSPYPASAEIQIAVRATPGGVVSPILARHVEVGDLLQVWGPRGFLTWTERDAGPLGLIGAGSGVAPMMSIVRYAASRQITVPMTLLSSSPDRSAAFFSQELEVLSKYEKWLAVVHTFTHSPKDDLARYHRRVDPDMLAEVMGLTRIDGLAPVSFYVAGPSAFVLSVRASLVGLGVSDTSIYSEDHA